MGVSKLAGAEEPSQGRRGVPVFQNHAAGIRAQHPLAVRLCQEPTELGVRDSYIVGDGVAQPLETLEASDGTFVRCNRPSHWERLDQLKFSPKRDLGKKVIHGKLYAVGSHKVLTKRTVKLVLKKRGATKDVADERTIREEPPDLVVAEHPRDLRRS